MEEKNKKSFWKKVGEYIVESLKLCVKYAFGKFVASVVLGVVAFAVLSIMKVNRAGIMAIIIGVTNVVPLIGPLIASIICSIIALFQQPIYGLYVLIATIVLQQFDQWILTPIFVGKSVSLSPILVVGAVMLGGWLFGVPGILLSVPIAAMVRLFYTMFIKKDKEGNKAEKTIEDTPSDPPQIS